MLVFRRLKLMKYTPQHFAKKLYSFGVITTSMASEMDSIKGTLVKLGFYPDEKSLPFVRFLRSGQN